MTGPARSNLHNSLDSDGLNYARSYVYDNSLVGQSKLFL